MMPLRRTCQQATQLMLQAQDGQPLSWPDRLALRLHLAACDACPRVRDQLAFMQRATAQWRRHAETDLSEPGDEADPVADPAPVTTPAAPSASTSSTPGPATPRTPP